MRLPAYEFSKDVAVELQEAIEDVRLLLNNGKYVPNIQTAEPSYVGEEGEFIIHNAGANKYLFTYVGGAWFYVGLTAGPLP